MGKHSKTLSTLKVHFFVFLHFLLEDKQYSGIQLQRKSSLDVQLAQNNAFQSMRLLYVLLTKQEVKMAGYWPSSLLHFVSMDRDEVKAIKMQKENESNIQLS